MIYADSNYHYYNELKPIFPDESQIGMPIIASF